MRDNNVNMYLSIYIYIYVSIYIYIYIYPNERSTSVINDLNLKKSLETCLTRGLLHYKALGSSIDSL